MTAKSQLARKKRHGRLRMKISGTPDRPRLNVFRSNRNIVAQVIDDTTGTTLASALSNEPSLASELAGKSKSEKAKRVGQVVAERALAAGIKTVVFDRGGYLFHGRVKALATAAREAGLVF